jgi:hypothetical protein
METRKLNAVAVSIATLLLLGSCTKSVFKTTSDKLMKSWVYEKVTFQKNSSFGKEDHTKDYAGVVLTFNDDFTIDEVNNTTGATRIGTWKVDYEQDEYSVSTGQTTNGTEILAGTLTDAASGAVNLLKWKSLSVTNSKIRAYEYKDDGTYCYTLVSQ